MRPKIDFWIIGAQKAGTTSLFDYCAGHPSIFMPRVKEVPHLVNPELYSTTDSYLQWLYKGSIKRNTVGGAYVNLLYFAQKAVGTLGSFWPATKCIAVLRNPVDRAYSAYWYAKRRGWEDALTFEQALTLEQIRATAKYDEQANLTYLMHGHYADQVRCFIEHFGRSNVLVLFTEELRAHFDLTTKMVCNFLEIDNYTCKRPIVSNAAGYPRSLRLQKFLISRDSGIKRIYHACMPTRGRLFVNRVFTRPLEELNVSQLRYPPMGPETRRALNEYYKKHNRELSDLLARQLPEWA